MSGLRLFHGTSAAHEAAIRAGGLTAQPDGICGEQVCWVTADRELARQYAACRVLYEALARSAGSRSALGLIVTLEVEPDRVRRRRLLTDELFIAGDVEPDRIVGADRVDVALLAARIALTVPRGDLTAAIGCTDPRTFGATRSQADREFQVAELLLGS